MQSISAVRSKQVGGMVPAYHAGHSSLLVLEGSEEAAGRKHYFGQCPSKSSQAGKDPPQDP